MIRDRKSTWLITYADTITLLLIFFILIASVSVVDQAKYETFVEELWRKEKREEKFQSPFKVLEEKLETKFAIRELQKDAKVYRHPRGLTVDISNESLYDSGRASLQPGAFAVIDDIAQSIKELEYDNFSVEIEGHTDDVPISNSEYSSNWELSVFRSIGVLQRFLLNGLNRDGFKIAGYADTRPKAPNLDENGDPIEENRALNRRVRINIFRKDRLYGVDDIASEIEAE